jgi:hypothetical protein
MATKEVPRRLAAIANVLMTISLFTIVLWFKASLILFVVSWILYGVAWIIDGSSIANGQAVTE